MINWLIFLQYIFGRLTKLPLHFAYDLLPQEAACN